MLRQFHPACAQCTEFPFELKLWQASGGNCRPLCSLRQADSAQPWVQFAFSRGKLGRLGTALGLQGSIANFLPKGISCEHGMVRSCQIVVRTWRRDAEACCIRPGASTSRPRVAAAALCKSLGARGIICGEQRHSPCGGGGSRRRCNLQRRRTCRQQQIEPCT